MLLRLSDEPCAVCERPLSEGVGLTAVLEERNAAGELEAVGLAHPRCIGLEALGLAAEWRP